MTRGFLHDSYALTVVGRSLDAIQPDDASTGRVSSYVELRSKDPCRETKKGISLVKLVLSLLLKVCRSDRS